MRQDRCGAGGAPGSPQDPPNKATPSWPHHEMHVIILYFFNHIKFNKLLISVCLNLDTTGKRLIMRQRRGSAASSGRRGVQAWLIRRQRKAC